VHPGVDAFQALIRSDLAPESDPESALDVPVRIERQRFDQELEQVGPGRITCLAG